MQECLWSPAVPAGAHDSPSNHFLLVPQHMYVLWFPASLPCSCSGHLPSQGVGFLGQTFVVYLCRWWCSAPPDVHVVAEDPRDSGVFPTLASLFNWAGSSCLAWASTKINSFPFYLNIKKRKAGNLCHCSVTSMLFFFFALGCGLPAWAWWCFRDLLSCSCLNKIFTFAQISNPVLSVRYAGLQKDFMEKYSFFFSVLSQFPSITCCQLSSPSSEAQHYHLLLTLTASPFGSSSAAALPWLCFHLSYAGTCERSLFKKLHA